MIPILHGLLGLLFVTLLAFLFSTHKKAIDWKLVLIGIALQFAFAFLVLKTAAGRAVFAWLSGLFVALFSFAADGAQFVFGPLGRGSGEGSLGVIFAFQVLPTIIFFAAFMAVLYHLGIMQWIVKGMAWVMQRFMRTSGAETLDVAANTFLGQTEAPLVIRPYLSTLTESELYTIMASGMAHISGGVLGAYMQMLGIAMAKAQGVPVDQSQLFFAGHLLAASIMAFPATMVVAKMLVPETGEPMTRGTVRLKVEKNSGNVIEAAAGGAGDGLRLALNVGGMLIAFIALIALINALLGFIGSSTGLNSFLMMHFNKPLNLELLFGLVFQFIAWIIGVPWKEALDVGSLMGIKLAVNEFVAYLKMSDVIAAGQLSTKSIVIATYALCGFANFASVAIQIGGLSPLMENRRSDIARLGLKSVLGGTIATWMTAAIAGILTH
ncbi:MAG TPA: nucleoside transporter C-terminal domain-containing protein [bacterium]|nr:nucleoside transporter C-terminal domain-containing protein [bacterium]HOH08231.1 nucleoside transporter C-terminal domain-containing protein [bacterium]HOY44138.1 nucleoside transporter C-terminal domain-containing protein [bacterium]HPG82186.1 nucleoside transporter C-terminal domain-containing protein [bacterium]HPM59235.1 nucleoside transporter C-terminal domain-containing protein [bacterium]